jgi:hypothetical protein
MEGANAGTGYFYQITVPRQAPGVFHHELSSADDFNGADVTIMLDGAGAGAQSDHQLKLEMAGRVHEAADTGYETLTGTFRATWGMPEALCSGGLPDECAAADVHGTFKVVQTLEF